VDLKDLVKDLEIESSEVRDILEHIPLDEDWIFGYGLQIITVPEVGRLAEKLADAANHSIVKTWTWSRQNDIPPGRVKRLAEYATSTIKFEWEWLDGESGFLYSLHFFDLQSDSFEDDLKDLNEYERERSCPYNEDILTKVDRPIQIDDIPTAKRNALPRDFSVKVISKLLADAVIDGQLIENTYYPTIYKKQKQEEAVQVFKRDGVIGVFSLFGQ
jgi:hypothetical protein